MRNCALSSLINRETTSHVTDPAYVVIPVHGIATLGFGHPPPVLKRVKCLAVKRLVSEVGRLQHNRRRAPDEAVLSHRTAIRDGRKQVRR